jgi:hypothetical protein
MNRVRTWNYRVNRRTTIWCERARRLVQKAGSATLVPAIAVGLAFVAQAASDYPQKLLVRAGTPVRLLVPESIDSVTSWPGKTVLFEVASDVIVGDLVVVRRGARAEGVISEQSKRAGSVSRPGRVEFSVSRVTSTAGDPIPVSGSQNATGAVFAPWVRGGNAVVRTGTKFYVFVSRDVLLDRTAVERLRRPVESPASIEDNLLTVFRCRDGAPMLEVPFAVPGRDHWPVPWGPAIEILMDRKRFLSLQVNTFLTVHLPEGPHVLSFGNKNLRIDPGIGSIGHIYVQATSEVKGGLSLEQDDDCHDVSAVLVPADWDSIANYWRDRQ